MGVLLSLSTLAVRELVGGACRVVGLSDGVESAQQVAGVLRTHFRDHSDRLTEALRLANTRAWQTLELALSGDSFWECCKGLLSSGEDKRFRREMQGHLEALTLPERDSTHFRRLCLSELRAARKAGLFDDGSLDLEQLANGAGAFARFGDPQHLLDAEHDVLCQVSSLIRAARYESLARLIELQPRPDTSLLTVTVRYFFRRSVEDDPKLFQGLAFAQLERLQAGQRERFAAVQELLDRHGERLAQLLDELMTTVVDTHNAVLDVREEQKRQAGLNDSIYQAVIDLQGRLSLMQQELRPRDSLSIRGDAERRLVKELVARYRALPEGERRDMPALLNAVGKLQVAAGDFQAAHQDFVAVAELVDDSAARAEARFNAYRAALERRDWSAALPALVEAAQLDVNRFEPFPLRKYRPERILGAGGFGVAFLCRHLRVDAPVVVKTLTIDDMSRDLSDVFAEARVLRQMDHPAIIGLRDCDYADDGQTRPYLEMDYFESLSLEEHVRAHGRLSERDLNEIAVNVAEGLRAAHARGVLHRDVKPGNLLVRRDAADKWQIKLIDFGLAVGFDKMKGSAASGTLRGSSIAGTIDYAAPEQMGKLVGVDVTEASDVYGFARTCFFALFGTPYPKAKHFDSLSPRWRSLLDDCVSEDPKERPANFDAVLARLQGKAPPSKPAAEQKSGWANWTDAIRGAFATNAPGAVSKAEKKPEKKTEKKPEVLDVIPMPPPTSKGIEIIDDAVLDVLPASKPAPPKQKPN